MALLLTNDYRLTPYGAPILALESFVMSPSDDDAAMDTLVACLEAARATVAATDGSTT